MKSSMNRDESCLRIISRQLQVAPLLGSAPHARQRLGLLITLFAAAVWLLHRLLAPPAGPDYVLVIDAGSSGTRMSAYEWHAAPAPAAFPLLVAIPPNAAPHKVPRRALENRRAYKRVETEPGLDKFLDSPKGMQGQVLAPLLGWAKAVVPRGRWTQTPVFLFGTAGMRRLREPDQGRLLGALRTALADSGFRFEPPWARVLTGEDEAVFGWAALNYASGTLGTTRTLGALDLGGSSLEVAFESDDVTSVSGVNVSVLSARHTLFTHSHHHYGLDDAFERSVEQLVGRREQPGNEGAASSSGGAGGSVVGAGADTAARLSDGAADSGNSSAAEGLGSKDTNTTRPLLAQQQQRGGGSLPAVEHPCLHQGYSQSYKRIPLNGRPPAPPEVLLVGAPNFQACDRLAASVVTSDRPCSAPTCALGSPQPKAAGGFVALSGFYVVRHFFKLPPTAGLGAVRHAARRFCEQGWTSVKAAHPGEMSVESYCFRAPYVEALVMQGLGLREDQVKIGDVGTAWTLGAALAEGHRLAGMGMQGGPRSRGRWAALRTPSRPFGALLAAAVALVLLWWGWVPCRKSLLRAVRTRLRGSASSNALPLSTKIAAAPAPFNGAAPGPGPALFNQVFGSPTAAGVHVKKSTPTSASGAGGAWQENEGEGGTARGRSLSRSELSRSNTFGRRLSALSEPDR